SSRRTRGRGPDTRPDGSRCPRAATSRDADRGAPEPPPPFLTRRPAGWDSIRRLKPPRGRPAAAPRSRVRPQKPRARSSRRSALRDRRIDAGDVEPREVFHLLALLREDDHVRELRDVLEVAPRRRRVPVSDINLAVGDVLPTRQDGHHVRVDLATR